MSSFNNKFRIPCSEITMSGREGSSAEKHGKQPSSLVNALLKWLLKAEHTVFSSRTLSPFIKKVSEDEEAGVTTLQNLSGDDLIKSGSNVL